MILSSKIRAIVSVSTIVFCLNVTSSVALATTYYRAPEVRVYKKVNSAYQVNKQFNAYAADYTGGGTVALGDLGGDNISEVITASGPDANPQVKVYRADGSLITQFYAYRPSMHAGVNVATGDVNGDKKDEIITGPQQGGGPQVRVFDPTGRVTSTAGFYAYDVNFRGGVNVAAGDLNCDGQAEIVTGNGIDGTPHVRVFSGNGTWTGWDVQPFAENNRGGVSVAVGNVDGGCAAEIITAVQANNQSWVKVYKYNLDKTVLGEWKAFPDDVKGGINIAAGDVDNDNMAEVIVGINGRGGSQVKLFEAYGKELDGSFFAYEADFHGGIHIAVGKTAAGQVIVTIPNRLKPDGRTDVERYVRVDLSEQRMYAYEKGFIVNSFLISSGTYIHPSPQGEFHIIRKLYSHLYAGPDYYLPNTLYNLEFKRGYYLHGAYWHNNFGHPMSHGCINIHYTNAKWLFDWMQTGDLTVIER
ncbi:MAG: L,D-transpeptidase family protein [Patescibacteria group bacterium]|jgi:hypothetical protein